MAVKQAYTLEEGLETLPTDLSILDSIPESLKHMSNADLLRKICTDRMNALGFAGKPEYEQRLERELGVILGKDFSVYFIMIYDIMKFCRDNGIVYGVGRGSACGSLVSYLLRITGVDPLEYNLLFERFLDESRSDMPDIDIDVQGNRRAEVKRYIERTYGKDHVAGIATYGYYQPAAAFKAAARVLGIPYAKANDVTINSLDDIPSAMESEFPGLKILTKSLIGQMSNTGLHAAGVVVSDKPITEYAPIETRKIPNEDAREAVVAMDKKVTEAVGLVKIDLLGLKTLSVVDDAIRIAEKSGEMKVRFDWKNMKQDDPAVYKMLSQGYTASVFQAEESASTNLLGKMKVKNFTELYTSNALVRSGAWNAFGDDYIATMRGQKKPWFPTEESKEFLEDTLGFCVPGEQEIMTPAGPVKMKDLEVLDKVCGEFDENIVLKKVDTGYKECVEIQTHDGRVVELSEDHPVKTIDGWKRAGDLTEEDYLIEGDISLNEDKYTINSEAIFLAGAIAEVELTNMEYQRIDRVKAVKKVGKKSCYDIQVTGDHTFLVDDIVTHNCTFQEQTMLMCQQVAGMSAQDSNAIRRLTAKKEDPKLLAPYKDGFIRGCIANGVPKEDAQRMWHDIEVTSEYQFNKCLAGDTVVTTKQYGDITIKDLYDKFSANPNLDIQVLGPESIRQRDVGQPVWHNVKDVMFQGNRPTVRVKTSSDTYIDSTYNHRHRLTKTWKQAGRIWQHDRIVTIDGAKTVYERRYNGYQDVYDIELESEPHAFYANGFVTHNSHAVAYSLLTYATAYLKRYYPGPWMTAVLNNETDTGKISTYLAECRRLGIDVKVPHVNKAEAQYSYKDGVIYMGLASVKFISDKSAEKIIAQRPYESYKHFQEVVFAKGSGINSRMSASLNAIGALEFEDNPVNMREAKMNYFEILGIPSFDDIMLPEKMRQRLTPLSEFSGKKVQIVMGVVNDITSKANWSRADLIDDESSATFFMNSPDQLKKGHRYVCLVAENSLMDAVDLSDLGDNDVKHPLMRWLNGDMDDGTYIVGGSFRTTKNGKDMATAVYSHNGNLNKFLALGDKVKLFKQTCKRGTKVLRLNLSPDGVWFNGARV